MDDVLVCIAYHFPPVLVPGSHRTRAIVRHLPAHGWRPVVVTARPTAADCCDDSLLEGLPEDLVVARPSDPMLLERAAAVRRWIGRLGRNAAVSGGDGGAGSERSRAPSLGWTDWGSRWLQTPDLAVGWLAGGLAATIRAASRHRARALYSSAPHWTAHLIGLLARRITGLPWTADFRDPWRSNPFRSFPYRSVDRFDAWLEARVVAGADRLVCNSEYVREDFAARYPHLAGRFTTIPNGFEPEDYAELAAVRRVEEDRFVFSHAGYFYGPRRPHAILEALRDLRGRSNVRRVPRLQLIGTPTYEGRGLEEIADEFGVRDLVDVLGEMPHRQALELMRGSDVQLLVGFGGPGSEYQVPAKLFEYLGVGRPILALAPSRGAIHDVLTQGGVPVEIRDPDDATAIADALERLESRPMALPFAASPTFHRRELVARLADVLEQACRARSVSSRRRAPAHDAT